MKTGIRLVAVALIASLLAGVVPPQAFAEEQSSQSPAQQPAPQPAQQPGMMQEQMKQGDDGYRTLANVFNIFYTPGKGILCTASGVGAFVLLITTFGSAHREAANALHEGCGGPWTLTADDVRPTGDDFYHRQEGVQQ